MKHLVRIALLTAILPLSAQAADTPVCPVRHHVVHRHKVAAHHGTGGSIAVVIDQARVISFAKPVKTLYVGNPTVVDVNMLDPQHAFILGKTFGETNMIALQADGTPFSNQLVTVLNNGSAVTVNRGSDQFDYTCSRAHCETAPRPGDPKGYVDNTESAAQAHAGYGNSAASTMAAAQQSPSDR
jgi:Flp pilus assembly secretin CpaC